ncbi:MAG: spondin domain-containing protein [Pseudomonadota bacterium]
MSELRVVVTNLAPTGGVFLTPFWFGFHDESFNLFDIGGTASRGLEAIAEDGDFMPIRGEFSAAVPDGVAGIITGSATGPIPTGDSNGVFVNVNALSNRFLSLAAMILPSNDAFVGTADAVELFDASGRFLGQQEILFTGADVLDAGTEVNTELDAAFINQGTNNTGIDENGVITAHPGFIGSAANPSVEGEGTILGGVNMFGETIDPVAADFTLPGALIASIHINIVARTDGTDGADRIFGSNADDIVQAGAGNDNVNSGAGWDQIFAGDGNDFVTTGDGNDEVVAGNGNDFVGGGAGVDTIFGDGGNDRLFGDGGNDLISGGDGADRLFGGLGNDALFGDAGNDRLNGGLGGDTLSGGEGFDRLDGGGGDDFILGGAGFDVITTGAGNDLVAYVSGDGRDIIRDFSSGEDQLLLGVGGITSFEDLLVAATQTAFGVTFDFGNGDGLTLFGMTLGTLNESDFLFGQ